MSRPFHFKQFSIQQEKAAHKVGTDGVILGAWAHVSCAQRALDVGTGTGLIALMLAQRSNAILDAVELDAEAAREAEANIIASPWANRVSMFHQSFQAFAETSTHKYDLIVSNPPYFIDSHKSGAKGRDLARHTDSLTFDELCSGADKLTNPNGRFAVILPADAGPLFVLAANKAGWHLCRKLEIVPNPGKSVKRVAMEFGRTVEPVESKTLVVELARHEYSQAYKDLTRDFYLNM